MAELHPLVEQVLKEAEEKRRAMRQQAVMELVALAEKTMPEIARLVKAGALTVDEEGRLVGEGLAPIRLRAKNGRVVALVGRWQRSRERWHFGSRVEDGGEALLLARERWLEYEQAEDAT